MKTINRNNKGQFARDLVIVKWFLIVASLYLAGVMIFSGVKEVYNRIMVVGRSFTIEKARAEWTLDDKFVYYAKSFGVSAYKLRRTAECESKLAPVQSNVIKNGKRENSWGIFQINLDIHPDITRAQAMNEDFAVSWAAAHFNTVTWFAYNRKTDTCN